MKTVRGMICGWLVECLLMMSPWEISFCDESRRREVWGLWIRPLCVCFGDWLRLLWYVDCTSPSNSRSLCTGATNFLFGDCWSIELFLFEDFSLRIAIAWLFNTLTADYGLLVDCDYDFSVGVWMSICREDLTPFDGYLSYIYVFFIFY